MQKKIILMFALLCAVAQGVWAQIPDPTVFDDVWDGHSTSKPEYSIISGVIIKKASELAYVRDHWKEDSGYESTNWPFRKLDYTLEANLDMGAVSWIPIGNNNGSIDNFQGTFYGNCHTIRIIIKDATKNYQGLFAEIGSKGKVHDLHVTGKIACKKSRLVGGIVGANESTVSPSCIKYCIMTGNVENNDASVDGIVGFNAGRTQQSKCVVEHVTFYGKVSSTHDQDNKYVGDQDGHLKDEHDSFTDSKLAEHLNSFTGNDLYRYAVKYPYAVTVNIVGPGTVRTWAADEYDVRGTRSGKTFSLNATSGAVTSVTIKDADGNNVPLQGHGRTNDGKSAT